ncbi:MAG: hypothetical protein EOM68_25500 [Spirochaetia bacterium]|nr:hypothetical protein [Spirochaetia bacterium]
MCARQVTYTCSQVLLHVSRALSGHEGRYKAVYRKQFQLSSYTINARISASCGLILSEAVAFIKCVIDEGGTVMVHCLEGKSRSVCVVIAYMTVVCNHSWDATMSYLLHIRQCIDVFPLYLQRIVPSMSAIQFGCI